MGKIFGISDLPVSTIMTPLEGIRVPEPVVKQVQAPMKKTKAATYTRAQSDKFISNNVTKKSNPIIKLRNGFGKLMKHFSKKAEV